MLSLSLCLGTTDVEKAQHITTWWSAKDDLMLETLCLLSGSVFSSSLLPALSPPPSMKHYMKIIIKAL